MISTDAENELVALGRRLRALRIERNDRQSDFAFRLGISVPTLRKLEQGDSTVSIGVWFDAFWLLGRLDDLQKLLVQPQSLFDRWEQQQKIKPRKRVSKS